METASPTVVTLSWPECEAAAYAGLKRQLLALHDDRPDYYGFNGEPWATHIEAAGAELAVARLLGLWWTPWARRPSDVVADVGFDVQVRRRARDDWDLILHEADRDDHWFVLVTGRMPAYRVHGFIQGAEGKRDEFQGDPYGTGRPAFWVPQSHLLPIYDAREVMAA